MQYTATIEKTFSNVHLAGEYKETDIDRRKREVDFRIIDVCGKVTIRWNATNETQVVTRRQLAKLEKEFTSACDF